MEATFISAYYNIFKRQKDFDDGVPFHHIQKVMDRYGISRSHLMSKGINEGQLSTFLSGKKKSYKLSFRILEAIECIIVEEIDIKEHGLSKPIIQIVEMYFHDKMSDAMAINNEIIRIIHGKSDGEFKRYLANVKYWIDMEMIKNLHISMQNWGINPDRNYFERFVTPLKNNKHEN